MKLNKQIPINDIYKQILSFDKWLELKSYHSKIVNEAVIITSAFEKRIFRNGQIATCSITFIYHEECIDAYILTSGGGKTAFDTSDNINRSFYEKMIECLESIGFEREADDVFDIK